MTHMHLQRCLYKEGCPGVQYTMARTPAGLIMPTCRQCFAQHKADQKESPRID